MTKIVTSTRPFTPATSVRRMKWGRAAVPSVLACEFLAREFVAREFLAREIPACEF